MNSTKRKSNKAIRKTTSKTKFPRKDIHKEVTDRILAHLEKGKIPWEPTHCAKVGFPHNFDSGNPYSGVNVWMLAMGRYLNPFFLTYKQAQALGGQVRKGEKGMQVIKYGEFKKETGGTLENGKPEEASFGYLRFYTVFNAAQIDGIEIPEPKKPDFSPSERVAHAKAIVEQMPNPPEIEEGTIARVCYSPKDDRVQIAGRAYFKNEETFYLNLFHELIHATGHSKRLARESLLKGSHVAESKEKLYAKEELVAEMGAAFLAAHAGIVVDDHLNSAAYVQGWSRELSKKEHSKWIVQAASEAQKAVNFILGNA